MLQIEHKLFTEDQSVTVYADHNYQGSIIVSVAEKGDYNKVNRLYLTAEQALGLVDLLQTCIVEANKHRLKV